MQDRIGNWIQTYSGRKFWPLDPRPDEVHLEDIAHSLSLRCRYGGHCSKFYSVAEHSIQVSYFVPIEYALWGLLHDAAETYSADVPRPLKRNLTEWKPMEDKIMQTICAKFNLPLIEPREVKYIDLAITTDETMLLMNPCEDTWGSLPGPIGANIIGYEPTRAKELFMARFTELTSNVCV